MNKDLRLSRVLLIVILAIILILVSLNISQLSLLLLLIPIPFALIGTLSNLKNNIISLSVTFLSLMYFTKYANAMDIFINSIIPGTIIFIISIVVHYLISKYVFKTDLLEELLKMFNESMEFQKGLFESTNNDSISLQNITDTFRNIIPSILFFRSMMLSIIIYFIEVFTLKKIKYADLSEIKFRNFYLPGNAIVIYFILYLIMILLSYIKTPLYTDAIFLNLEIIFNFMFIIQGISVTPK